jgi:hypothetical protein
MTSTPLARKIITPELRAKMVAGRKAKATKGRSKLPQDLTPAQLARIADAPEHHHALLRRVYAGKATPKAITRAFCLQCTGYSVTDVRECSASACPQHPTRPYQKADADSESDDA